MCGEIKDLYLCENEKERQIVRRVDKLTTDQWLFWQDLDSYLPFLIFVFIGSTIFRNHWVAKIIIIIFVVYGYRIQYCYHYYYDVILARKFKFEKKKQ